jgi:acyl phosphate:glycerol-3-phosphate acyltransferase
MELPHPDRVNITSLIILIPVAYLIGSIPFGLLVGFAKGIDVRTAGSKNIGATNAGRLLGKKFFFIVFFLDMSKSLAPMLIASGIARQVHERDWKVYLAWLGVGFAAVLGHMFSAFLRFKGGKGVASSAGMMLGLYPYYTVPGAIAIGVFIVVLKIWDMISLGSIVAAWAFPVIYLGMGLARKWDVFGQQLPLLIFAVVIAVLITIKHRANIKRIRDGTENKFSARRDQGSGVREKNEP